MSLAPPLRAARARFRKHGAKRGVNWGTPSAQSEEKPCDHGALRHSAPDFTNTCHVVDQACSGWNDHPTTCRRGVVMVLVQRGGSGKRLASAEGAARSSQTWFRSALVCAGVAASRLLVLFAAWRSHAAERRYLVGLSEYHLKDIGLSRSDVTPDSAPQFWLR